MTYAIKEIFYSLQGEGFHTGRAAIFLRFAGCNLWSGLERDRVHAQCNFCDTDFVGTNGTYGGKYKTATELAKKVMSLWPQSDNPNAQPMVICTGGEPLLQLDSALITALKEIGFYITLETNGTLPAPNGIDWITVSPKANTLLKQLTGNELKLVYPQTTNKPHEFEGLDFTHFYLQPKDDNDSADNSAKTIDYIKAHPRWKLSLQTHKTLGIR